MNRVELGTKLTKIAEDAVEESDAQKTAASMIVLAKEFVSFDPPAEMEKSIEALAKLGKEFKDGQAQLIQAITETEDKLAEQRKLLTAMYKDWEVKSGYRQLRAELIEQAHRCMAIGDSLTDLSGELTLSRRESDAESYKEKYNILVSMLNDAELAKYSKIIGSFFRKQRTELDDGLKELNDFVERWHDSAKAIAKERGVELPAFRGGKKFAGFIGDIVDMLKSIIPGLIKGIQSWGQGLYSRIVNNGKVLDVMDAKLGRMVAKARSVL
jgi:hypothetical protein